MSAVLKKISTNFRGNLKYGLCLHNGKPHILVENKPVYMAEGDCCISLLFFFSTKKKNAIFFSVVCS